MSIRPIRFFHRGQIVEVADAAPTRSVLDWLREDARCTGTKEGCNEGDCGACTVVLGELDGDGRLALASVNACIQFLPTLDGKALFTVEDLKSPQGELHPVQQAMVECHGSQCGFCTPGFVMSMWSAYQRHAVEGTRPTRQQMADELAGNLCRCTGYRPILDAGERMFELPAAAFDDRPVIDALRALRAAPAAAEAPGAGFHAPRTLDELAALLQQQPQARLLAGSTDIGLWVNKQFREVGTLVYTGAVEEMKRIAPLDGGLWIGAAASLEAAWAALAERHPALTEVWLRFASPPIRHAGTMGGNVANGSPIGDSPPVLMALDAEIELRQGARVRRMPLPEFYLGYMKNRLEPGEFVQALWLPELSPQRAVRAYKISKRYDCDISALLLAAAIELDGDGRVTQVRLAFGGMAAVVKRAAAAEAALLGQPWNETSLLAAQRALAQDFQPLTDLRASAEHRMRVAANLLRRFWLETRPDAPLARAQVNVFAAAC